MRTIVSLMIMIVASVIGFLLGSGMNDALGGATLFATISGIVCVIMPSETGKIQVTIIT